MQPHGFADRTMHRRVARYVASLAALAAWVAMAACSNPPESPWVRKMPRHEREAWPTRCGIPEGPDIGRSIMPADAERKEPESELSIGKFFDDAATDTPTMVACAVVWDLERDRMWNMWVNVAFSREMTEADIAPYLDLIAPELKPNYRALALQVARGPARTVALGELRIYSGFERGNKGWQLYLLVPPVRKNEKGGLPTDK